MLSGLSRLVATGLTLAGLLVYAAPSPARATDADTTPLSVSIDDLTPSSIPGKGQIEVSGSVTNDDSVPWLDVSIYPFISSTPITSQSSLESAAATDADADVGGRITEPGDFETFAQIAPGQTVSYTLEIPRKDLKVHAEGVYWFGVHALGSGPDGHDNQADGRARTFLPLVSRTAGTEHGSVVVPIRARVIRKPDGSLDRVDDWVSLLGPDGRLGRLAAISSTAARPLSWLVDPAVLAAIQQLAGGDKPRNLGPTTQKAPPPSTSPTVSRDAADLRAIKAAQAAARAWLDHMLPILQGGTVLALPYGDLDLSAAAQHGSSFYALARDRGAATFKTLGIDATDYNAPLDGLVDAAGVGLTDHATPMLVSDQALPTEDAGAARVDADGWHLVPASLAASDGGPEPGDTQAGVAMRQRVLAEAAVRLMDPARPPLVVSLPTHWPAADAAGFASGLDVPWLTLTAPMEATYGSVDTEIGRDDLTYPADEARAQVNARAFDQAEQLIKEGRVLQAVLARNDQVAGNITDEALTSVGYPARGGRGGAAAETSREWVESRLDEVSLQAPPSVTLSGTSGRFPVTVVNDLAQPITVALRYDADPGVRVRSPKSIAVGPHGRAQLLLTAHAKSVGIHNVTLHLVDPRGVELAAHATFPVRSAQVSSIIWAFLLVGGALLFGAIGLRVVRRVRSHRA